MIDKKLIICDDDQKYCNSLKQIFSIDGWSLCYTKTLEELKIDLSKNGEEYFAIILDIKGLIDSKQTIEDSGFIGTALKYLDKNHPGIQRAILSGEERDFSDVKKFNPDEKVFQKTRDGQDALRKLLKEYVDNSEIYKIRAKEPQLYENFQKGYLEEKEQKKLDKILGHLYGIKLIEPADLYDCCRELLEDVFTALNNKSEYYLPNEFFTGTRLNMSNCIKYLSGQPVNLQGYSNRSFNREKMIPDFINQAMFLVYKNASGGLHTGGSKATVFTQKATIYGCLDCLKWFKDFMDSKDPYKD
jgi:hypothetical protein